MHDPDEVVVVSGSLDALIGDGDQPLILFDRVGDVVFVNAAFEALSGYRSHQLAAMDEPLLEPPILVARALDRTWTVPTGRVWLRHAERSRLQVWVDALPMKSGGQMLHLCTVRPTSVQVEAPSIGLDDARLRELLANLPGGVYRCSYDRGWRTLFMSERFADICGCPSAEFLEPYGRSFKDIVLDEDIPRIQRAVRRAITERSFYEVEFRIMRPDGEVRWLLDRGMPVADRAGRVRWLDGAMFDITAQKAAEARAEALEVERAAAEAASAAKSRFLAVMSHEMRTPLNAIVGMTTLLANARLDADEMQMVETARVSSDALLALIDDVLDFSRIDTGRLDLQLEDFDVRECVESTIALVRPRARARGLGLMYQVADEVPRWVVGDGARLRRVLLNLVGNAVKFTDRGRVELTVGARAGSGSDVRLVFAVRDTGIGIPLEHQEAVFRAFHQVDASTTRRHAGTGLGLAISHELVGLMGGELGLQSTPGVGSVFSFELEMARGAAPVPVPERDPMAALRPLRVLLVEDNPVNQMVAVRLLGKLGLEADIAGDGIDALAMVEHAAYDLVLMDIRMPRLDGLEAARRIRERLAAARQPRIVALTANATRADEAACRAAGMDDFLSKPLRIGQLEGVLLGLFGCGGSNDGR